MKQGSSTSPIPNPTRCVNDLQALKEYYDRKAADPESGIAPPGWERKELLFLITLAGWLSCRH